MQEEEKTQETSAHEAEAELEFRPWVKWCGLGIAGVFSVGFFLVTYYVGYSQGESEGFLQATCSGMVQHSLNEAASKNVLNFMRLSSASDEELLKAAMDTEAALGWIKQDEVRQEAEWCLAEALLERGKADAVQTVLSPLFKQVPHTIEWAYRALQTANQLASLQHYNAAKPYYELAIAYFAENKQENWRLEAIGQLIALEACSPQESQKTIAALEELLRKLKNSDEGTRQLRSIALVYIGQHLASSGKRADAEKKFRAALSEVEHLRTVRPEGAVSRGIALLALGDAAAAEPMLRIAEKNPGNSISDVSTRLLALRELAVIEQQRGHHVTALALLHRAQGVAEGRVQPGNPFWPCLYDQRGWMHYLVQNYQTALLDFKAALASTKDPLLLMQPQEGAARCYLELGRGAEAQPLLESCLKLRSEQAAADKAALGRLHLLLGQIYDQQGKVAEAEAAYANAVNNLPQDNPDEQINLRTALMGRAYALTEQKRWTEAYETWEKVLPLVAEQHDRREEARQQMRHIKSFISAEAPAQ